jgi:CubicO group peptidase (beta-lactamase class C family)
MSRIRAAAFGVGLLWACVSTSIVQAIPEFVTYHDVLGSEHQRRFNDLYGQGFRIISLTVYGNRDQPRYAAVWVKRAGSRWAAIHGVDARGFQAAFDTWAQRGFTPTIIAATGPSDNPVFAAVFEETREPIPLTRHGLVSGSDADPRTIEYWLKEARSRNWIPTTLAIYGSAQAPRFVTVLEPNRENVAWGMGGLNQTGDEYQVSFNVLTSVWNRPAYVAVSPAGRYLSLFRDDQIGPWIARHGMTSADYQAEFDRWVAEGYYPILVQAGGTGSGTRFAAIFSQRESALPRRFMMTGPDRSPPVDDVMQRFMQKHAVRQAALAIVKDRRLVYARGFTWAEAGYPLTQPTTFFRVASCSKVLTSIAMHQLIQEGRLRLTDKVQDILQLRTPSGRLPTDPRFADITVAHLLAMRGWMSRVEEAEVAAAFNQSLPVTSIQVARLIATQQLRNDPGASGNDPDGNPDFLLLGLIAEKLRGQSLLEIIRTRVGAPVGAQRIRLGVPQLSRQPQDEARYHDVLLSTTLSDVEATRPLVPFQYGEFDYATWAAAGGFAVAAVDLAKLLASLNTDVLLNSATRTSMLRNAYGWDWSRSDNGTIHAVKGGLLTGLQSTVNFTQGGLAYVLYWNRSELPQDPQWYPEFPSLLEAIERTSWSAGDLFTSFGIPVLP